MLKNGIVDLRKRVRNKDSLNDLRMQINSVIDPYNKNDQKPIFICTSARSGSTWLMQMISSAEGLQYVDQPLDIRNFNSKKYDLEPDWRFLYKSSSNRNLVKKYIDDLVSGNITLQFPYQFWLEGFDLKSNRRVFKILFGLYLINWLEENFESYIVYLVRHPVATALSRSKYDWPPFSYVKQILQKEKNSEIFPESVYELEGEIYQKGSDLEKYTFQWCVENYFPLKYFNDKNWLMITYEELVLNTEDLIDLMIDKLNLKDSDYNRMTKMVTKKAKSPMTHEETERFLEEASNEDDRSYLVKKWKDEVTEKQENSLFDILERFELDIYEKDKFLPTSEYLHFL